MIKTFNGQNFLLTSDKVLVHKESNSGFIADLHLGKTAHFRKAGIAIPSSIITYDLAQLAAIIIKFDLKNLFFLGDLFHSNLNHEWRLFQDFIENQSETNFTLIKGNHDILSEEDYLFENFNIEEEPFKWGDFLLTHHPLNKESLLDLDNCFNLAGHLHPGGILRGKGKTTLRLPAYIENNNQLILPAFGRFTGLYIEKSNTVKRTYLIGGSSIIEQP